MSNARILSKIHVKNETNVKHICMRVIIGRHLQVTITNVDSNLWNKPCVSEMHFCVITCKFTLKQLDNLPSFV